MRTRLLFMLTTAIVAMSIATEARAQGVWQDAPGEAPVAAGPTGSAEAISHADRSARLRIGRMFVTPLAGALVGGTAGGLVGGLTWAACGGDCIIAAGLLSFTAYVLTVPLGVNWSGRLMRGLGSDSYWLQVLSVALVGFLAVGMSTEMPAVGIVMANLFCPIIAMVVFESRSHAVETGLRTGEIEPSAMAAVVPALMPVTASGGGIRGATLGLAWRGF